MSQTQPTTLSAATVHNGDIADHPAIALVLSALEKLRFGAINITVHEGRLVQVDVTERSRFQS
jgi:hypothetical protein